MKNMDKQCFPVGYICTATAVGAVVIGLAVFMNMDGLKKKKFMNSVEEAIDTAIETIAGAAEKISSGIFER